MSPAAGITDSSEHVFECADLPGLLACLINQGRLARLLLARVLEVL